MSENRFHLVLAIVMFAVLFLPMLPGPLAPLNWSLLLFLFYDTNAIEPGILPWLRVVPTILASLGVPILMVLNLLVALFPTRGWKTLYRVSLLILFPLMWWLTFRFAVLSGWEVIGFWAMPIVVTVAALFEIGFAVKAWKERRKAAEVAIAVNERRGEEPSGARDDR